MILRMRGLSTCWANWRGRTVSGPKPSRTLPAPPSWTPTFGDAYLGLGVSLISSKQFPEAVPPLETAVKLEPRNPAAHYNLAMAYNRSGRKQDADREFAIHRQMTEKSGAQPGSPAGTQPENPN